MRHVHVPKYLGHGRLELIRLIFDGSLPLTLVFEQSLKAFIHHAVEIQPTTPNANGVAGLYAALYLAALAFLT